MKKNDSKIGNELTGKNDEEIKKMLINEKLNEKRIYIYLMN